MLDCKTSQGGKQMSPMMVAAADSQAANPSIMALPSSTVGSAPAPLISEERMLEIKTALNVDIGEVIDARSWREALTEAIKNTEQEPESLFEELQLPDFLLEEFTAMVKALWELKVAVKKEPTTYRRDRLVKMLDVSGWLLEIVLY